MVVSSDDFDKRVDDRSPTAKAMSKVSEILASCLLMIVPALIGIWLDRTFSTIMAFTLIGLVFGITGAFLQLKRLVSTPVASDFDRSKIIKFDSDQDNDWSGNENQQ